MPSAQEFFVHLMLDFGLLEVASDRGRSRFLIEQFAVDLDLEIFEVGLSGFELIFGVESFALEDGVAEFEDDAVWLNDGAGMQNYAIDAGIGLRGDPADVHRHESANAANLADHGAALDFVGPDGGFAHGGEQHGRSRVTL